MSELKKIVQELKQHLQYQKHLGLTSVPRKKMAPKTSSKPKTLEEIHKELGECTRCPLHEGRKNIVFGVGNPKAALMFIGEAPGRDEDTQGEPFVGRAGQLLTKIIEAMGYKRSDVYITNIVKSRPPENRAPLPNEVATCIPFLYQQIESIQPKVIVCLGSVAVQNLLKTDQKITGLRGHWQDFQGFKVMPTYHPAFLLRNPEMKRYVWEDMKKVRDHLKRDC